MLEISHGQLRVEFLDPATDFARLGPRFAWGGFIWQVHDRTAGPLLTGPEWPAPAPLPFNGQGLPESFRHRTRSGRPLTWQGDRGVALGAGELAVIDGDARVIGPCDWTVTRHDCGIRFATRHAAAGCDYELQRTVELFDRELRSSTRLVNHGSARLTLEWFVHPFFALTDGLIALDVPPGSTLPANPGFDLAGDRLRQKRRFADQNDGHLDYLRLPPGTPLRCRLTHPRLTHVDFATSFAPTECLVWGNSNTFSIEPYQAIDLAPGEQSAWVLTYGFGAAR